MKLFLTIVLFVITTTIAVVEAQSSPVITVLRKETSHPFTYDPFRQLSSVCFLQLPGTQLNQGSQYAEQGLAGAGSPIGYDKNGNLQSLLRTDGAGNALHRLEYSYNHPTNGNALTSITLNGTPSNAFEYDQNGNMTFDGQSSVRIAYNLLNLPEKVSAHGNEATYIYSADGTKLATIAPNGSRTYYRSVFTYAKEPDQPEALLYALHPEGIVTKTNTSWEYKYFKRDHAGSTRVLLAARGGQLVTEQQTDYYPFGLTHGGFNNLHLNRYLYGGKEYQDVALGGTVLGLYDFHARYYNPLLGRWFNPDPANQTTNPYLYCGNSPMIYIDPSGEIFFVDDVVAGIIGGVVNLGVNAFNGNLKGNFWKALGKGAAAFGAGFAAGAMVTWGPVGWAAGGAIVSGTNAWLGGADSPEEILMASAVGSFSSLAGGAMGQWAVKGLGSIGLGALDITSPILKGGITGTIGGTAGGYAGGFIGGLITTGSVSQAHKMGVDGALTGAPIGFATGAASGYVAAQRSGINPWTGDFNFKNTSAPIDYDFTLDPLGDNITLYRGTTGSEGNGGPLFMTDNLKYAASYVKNGGQVVQVTIPRSTYLQMQYNGHIQTYQGIHGGIYGYEYQIDPSITPFILKLFK